MPTNKPYPWGRDGYEPLKSPAQKEEGQVKCFVKVVHHELAVVKRYEVILPVKTRKLDAIHDAYEFAVAKAGAGHELRYISCEEVEGEDG